MGQLIEAHRGSYREAFEGDGARSLYNVLASLDEVGHVMPWAMDKGNQLVQTPAAR